MMPQSRIAFLVAFVMALSCALSHAAPKPRADLRDSGTDEVKLVLQREQHSPIDRRAELQSVLKRQPDLATARWQSGYIEAGKTWRSYNSLADPKALDLLEQYRERRTALDGTVRSQLELARWCRQHELKDPERAHGLAALAFARPAEQPSIIESLGYRQLGQQWLSPQEVDDWLRYSRAAKESLKVWGSRIERLAAQFEGSSRQRESARAALLDIRDPAAIPALELHLATRGVSHASLLVDILDRIPAHEASSSLAKLAVFSESAEVRKAAAPPLAHRRVEDFVPALIDLLSTPAEPAMRIHSDATRGALYYTYIVRQELYRQIRTGSTTLSIDDNSPQTTLGLRFGWVRNGMRGDGENNQFLAFVSLDSERSFAEVLRDRREFVDKQNDSIAELNRRISAVLCSVSNEPADNTPHQWWSWWGAFSDTEAAQKRVVVEEESNYISSVVALDPISCFAAGTPVWTENGAVPIETLQVGDRVLAQNVDTGELAFKPVLRKTVRPPRQLTRVTAGGEQIVCTGGHRFWVAGKAWVKARDLSPSHLLHTVTGTKQAESTSGSEIGETHNLVVAEFHSYFVGQQAFLVQDLPLPRSTNCVVPGLQPEW